MPEGSRSVVGPCPFGFGVGGGTEERVVLAEAPAEDAEAAAEETVEQRVRRIKAQMAVLAAKEALNIAEAGRSKREWAALGRELAQLQ